MSCLEGVLDLFPNGDSTTQDARPFIAHLRYAYRRLLLAMSRRLPSWSDAATRKLCELEALAYGPLHTKVASLALLHLIEVRDGELTVEYSPDAGSLTCAHPGASPHSIPLAPRVAHALLGEMARNAGMRRVSPSDAGRLHVSLRAAVYEFQCRYHRDGEREVLRVILDVEPSDGSGRGDAE